MIGDPKVALLNKIQMAKSSYELISILRMMTVYEVAENHAYLIILLSKLQEKSNELYFKEEDIEN